MKKIVVIGCPGSGKSHLSRRLHECTGLPLYHLDMLYWNSDRTTVSRELFCERLGAILEGDVWIIDGNYSSTMEWRISMCDTVIFLDYKAEVCLRGISERRGKARPDMPWSEDGDIDIEFVRFVERFNIESRPKIVALLGGMTDKRIIWLRSRKDADEFLKREFSLDFC